MSRCDHRSARKDFRNVILGSSGQQVYEATHTINNHFPRRPVLHQDKRFTVARSTGRPRHWPDVEVFASASHPAEEYRQLEQKSGHAASPDLAHCGHCIRRTLDGRRESVCALKRGGNCATSRAVVVLIKRAQLPTCGSVSVRRSAYGDGRPRATFWAATNWRR